MIYLDYNATTPSAAPVQEAMLPFLAVHFGNPSSGHPPGRAAKEAIEDARGRVANLIGARHDEIIFTGGGTGSNNLAIKGVALRDPRVRSGHIIISAIEHPAVSEPARFLQRMGFDVTVVECNRRAVVDPDTVKRALRPETLLVSVMHANNEVGTIQPIRQIAEICHERNTLVHTDASQSTGKIPVRVDELGVDLLTIAGHKIYAPKGVGALYVRGRLPLEPVLHGGGHEGGYRAGTENTPQIVGLGKAAQLAFENLSEIGERMATLRDRLETSLFRGIGPALSINAQDAPRLPNTSSVNFPAVSAQQLLARTPEIYASTGAACHTHSTQLSATQQAMGLDEATARGTVRLSVGWYTTETEIDRVSQLLIGAWENIKS